MDRRRDPGRPARLGGSRVSGEPGRCGACIISADTAADRPTAEPTPGKRINDTLMRAQCSSLALVV